jgi:hypothetical protein
VERRTDTAGHGHEEAHHGREQQNMPVDRKTERNGHGGFHDAQRDEREADAGERGDRCERERLAESLPDDAPP